MPNPVVHFEIDASDPDGLAAFYRNPHRVAAMRLPFDFVYPERAKRVEGLRMT